MELVADSFELLLSFLTQSLEATTEQIQCNPFLDFTPGKDIWIVAESMIWSKTGDKLLVFAAIIRHEIMMNRLLLLTTTSIGESSIETAHLKSKIQKLS